jgi:hypothetical protein
LDEGAHLTGGKGCSLLTNATDARVAWQLAFLLVPIAFAFARRRRK